MSDGHSDALVFFGATGDLAYKKIFPALQAMVKRKPCASFFTSSSTIGRPRRDTGFVVPARFRVRISATDRTTASG